MRRKSEVKKRLIRPITERYHDYLTDESNMIGAAESISFPESETEIIQILRVLQEKQIPVTIQGGKTGLVGAAVPMRGHIMNLSGMKRVKAFSNAEDGTALLTVEPGVTLIELRKAIGRLNTPEAFFWPPESSELTATVGGVASTSAKSICSGMYGDVGSYIDSIRATNAEGAIDDIKKGQRTVSIDGESEDLLAAYLGAEGMYGVITELTLRLIPTPAETWGITFFFEGREDGLSFAENLKDGPREIEGARIAAIEYLDRATIEAIEKQKQFLSNLRALPDVPANTSSMVYVEIHGEREEAVEAMAETLLSVAASFHNDPSRTWAFSGELEIEKMRNFLHAAVETALLHIRKVRLEDPRITRLGIDMSWEHESLKILAGRFQAYLREEGLSANLFAHVGNNRLHINILPKNFQDYVKGTVVLEKWAETFTVFRGTAVTEYGIGKMKKSIFRKAASQAAIERIIQLKKQLDTKNMWNPGNMLDIP